MNLKLRQASAAAIIGSFAISTFELLTGHTALAQQTALFVGVGALIVLLTITLLKPPFELPKK